MVQGWDIDIRYADIDGDLDIGTIADKLEKDDSGKLIIEGSIRIRYSNISGNADFSDSTFIGVAVFNGSSFSGYANFSGSSFSGDVSFNGSSFSGYANFSGSSFSGDAYFRGSSFSGYANFYGSSFSGYAYFYGSSFGRKLSFISPYSYLASFSNIKFGENITVKGLWNLFFGWNDKLKWNSTDFLEFDAGLMNAASNPYLKRYVEDEQWINSWKKRSRWNKFLFFWWELTSHCGRSFGLWIFWVLVVALFFGAVYANYTVPEWITPDSRLEAILIKINPIVEVSPPGRIPTSFTPYYFSLVTFTTLGFGDIKPLNLAGEIWLAVEVLLGYIMLGGLVSILATKFARRS